MKTLSVAAFESEENYTPAIASGTAGTEHSSDIDYEGTAIVGTTASGAGIISSVQQPEPSELPHSPSTGVEIAIIPAAIALIALVGSIIVGKIKKGKK